MKHRMNSRLLFLFLLVTLIDSSFGQSPSVNIRHPNYIDSIKDVSQIENLIAQYSKGSSVFRVNQNMKYTDID